MLAPEPFFEPRGTPFSEYHRIKALGELGHHVDLVTYPIGRDVELPNLRIFRSLRPPFVSKVRIGPSITKVILDALMLLTIARRIWSERYDAIHSHEDRFALHRFKADESYQVGRGPHLARDLGPIESYLSIDEVIRAVRNALAVCPS